MKVNSNFNRINTKEELIELLEKYKGILANPMIDYLNSLINLEFSVIKNHINESDRVALSELEIYRNIGIYNIYNRALKIFKKDESELIISGNNDGIEGLNIYASLGEKDCILFDFNYRKRFIESNKKISCDHKIMKIGDISLFRTIESIEQKEAELMRIMSELDKLYNEKNPYSFKPNTYGGPFSNWEFEHYKKISEYEEKFNLLDSKKELTDVDKKEIEITKKFNELLLEDYGLKDSDFEDTLEYETKLQKTLVKKIPNINIKNNIKYI